MKRFVRLSFFLLFTGSLLTGMGCGKKEISKLKTVQVSGQVRINGEAARYVSLTLKPEDDTTGEEARAHTDGEGRFSVFTYSNTSEPDGAVPATYQITVSNWNEGRDGRLPKDATNPTKVPQEARDAAKTVEITEADDNLELDYP